MFDLSGIQDLPELLEDARIAGATSFELFERIVIPAGGGTRFDVPGPSGSTAEESLEGVVIHSSPRRAYWPGDEPAQGNPPSCSSDDGVNGVGDPGGPCSRCPLNQWGSAQLGTGKGKACKETLQLFVLRSGEALPVVLNLPPSSLRPWSQYVARLAREKRSARATITEFSLDPIKNSSGIVYSQIKCTALDPLPDDSVAAVRQAGNAVAPIAIARAMIDDTPALEPVDYIPTTTVQSPPVPPMATPAETPANKAPDAIMASLQGMADQLGVPPETLSDYVIETYEGRSYLQLTTTEVTATMQWLGENYG